MIAGQQKRLAVPHEEGAEITLRSLGHKLLRDAQQKQIRSAMDEVKGLDIDFAALQEAVKTGDLDKSVTGGDKAKKDEAEDYTYDMDMVLEAGIVAWSYEGIEVSPATIGQLDPETAEWAFKAIVDMSRRKASERKA